MTPTRAQELAVLRSVTYASLFDYPLTLAQLRTSLLEVRAGEAAVLSWWRGSELLQATVEYRDGLFFPAGRGDLPGTRRRREAVSRRLLEREQRIVSFVSRTPFVRMVAVSGSLAHLNAEGSADLDLFVITAPHRVWSVTLSVLVVARLLGCRRRLCLNYIVSEQALAIEPDDLFSANQIIHLRPVYGHEVFERFVGANAFVRRYYPNFAVDAASRTAVSRLKSALEALLSLGTAPLMERLSRALYGWHLRRRAPTWQSREQVRLEPECLKLHTISHRAATLERYDAAMTAALERTEALGTPA